MPPRFLTWYTDFFLKSMSMFIMFARPLLSCCQQLSQASCSTTGSTKIEGKSSLKDARTGHDDEIASKSSENRSGLSRAGKCQRGRALKSCSNNRRLKNMQVMLARPLHFCCQQLSQASCSTTGSTKIEGKSSLKDARTGHDDEIASKSSENRSGLSNSAPRVAWSLLVIRLTQKRRWSGSKFQDKFSFVLGQVRKEDLAHDILQVVFQGPARLPAPAP